ncbi:accessory Sec system protein Asp3 [Macrococcoides bohemicum]|uniref:Accessory Sec system protein Asp3 n=1 Tax=Macrococcoides bohemicum TaxID=1903056 RepID=A0A328A2I4_9STAP|nr:accessory Sec system protein Asp3 [Macrococcus bohemicus]QRN50740.1 accessory Sec system protein Asp3 [Macrococcus bohemicus]RAK48557.1 accessory Sec system protein Asp3 [Macrococcus bohemicus]
MNNIYNIYWNNIDKITFLYGTKLKFVNRCVEFENFQIPAGITIHLWRMKTSFYNNRIHPSLPLLSRNEYYTVQFKYECKPENGIYFVIEFYKKNDEIIETLIVQDKEVDFVYPENADYYQIKMMSASVNQLKFDCITLTHQQLLMDMSNAIDIYNRWSNEVL